MHEPKINAPFLFPFALLANGSKSCLVVFLKATRLTQRGKTARTEKICRDKEGLVARPKEENRKRKATWPTQRRKMPESRRTRCGAANPTLISSELAKIESIYNYRLDENLRWLKFYLFIIRYIYRYRYRYRYIVVNSPA
jgi:hypothetical protein